MIEFTEKQAQRDQRIIKLFSKMGVEYITHPVAQTNKGELAVMLRKGETAADYRFVFDSVPVEDEDNDTLKELFSN